LVRNEEPTLRSPVDLFAAADRLGRLKELGRIVRNRVAATAAGGPNAGQLFVNVHASDLDDDSLTDPSSPLSAVAGRVVLEITERVPIERIRDIGSRVAQLRALGYRIAVDDLGAGYAGLTTFAQLEPEVVKVDMSLIRGLDQSPTKKKLLRSIVGLCRDLGIQMIAEGIETEAERDALIGLGGDLCQGFLFARPNRPFPNVTL
jgi:EAL domain-containing protein (putative c-di-GMP-specific phosphodiesterase class I)